MRKDHRLETRLPSFPGPLQAAGCDKLFQPEALDAKEEVRRVAEPLYM